MAATIKEVAAELESLDIVTQVIPAKRTGSTDCLNVFAGDASMPDATVWPPHKDYGWAWGFNYEHAVDAGASAATVAAAIKETLP